ncbi:MAG: UDP-glucose/GDP-mannose dehydrogenase family protein [Gemmatimonadota bacterium]|nr:UDP-glucose/GDP-mannose dehydrogenase family protein [Gemmatimonadota bacterium]MDE3005517.1 UDP-glucose/GDP-mannose dehydrogenase family protein [Gemmatimonadota bacterium]MDE3014085.1 UDP-glucose/GDP-mannose dehydrogenase family protein [Gemmatimonadota bacterium]
MNVGIVGSGYVGLVVGACLAESGNDVICADIDESKIARLNEGDVPIYEPGLNALIERNLEQGRLSFTTDVAAAVKASHVIFIAVGTPPDEDGSADLQHVLAVARTIGQAMEDEKIVITKSTVPVGTARRVREAIEQETDVPVHVCSNPEFLREGAAIDDFMKPDRVVIGVDSEHAGEVLRELYAPLVRTGHSIMIMDVPAAEITKYAANAMLATRISFMNSIARLCEATGVDVNAVRKGIGSDSRIGSSFLFPGVGYGGSCFPKDVKALVKTMGEFGVDPSILQSVEDVNESQKSTLLERLLAIMGDDLSERTIAVWGLAFKPNTDDMREAPSLVTIEGLLARGARVVAHDPVAMTEARHHLGDRIEYVESNYDALGGADALLIHTEWHPYRSPDFRRMAEAMSRPLILDGRNLYDPADMAGHGFQYVSIGRAPVGV